MTGPAPARRRRRWPLLLALLALLLAGGVWWLARLLEPERLAAMLLQRASAASGLALHASGPAGVGLWPDLHLSLAGLTATAPGAAEPLFTTRELDMVLPWSSLLDREPVLQHVRLVGPELQRDALSRWLDSLPEAEGPPAPMRLPELATGIELSDGRVTGDDDGGWSVSGLALDTSPLREGQPFTAGVEGILHLDAKQYPVGLQLATVPRSAGNALQLGELSLQLQVPPLTAPLALDGQIEVQHPVRLAFHLAGGLQHWPEEWPALPAPALPIQFELRYDGPTDLSAPLAVLATGSDGAQLQLQAAAPGLLAWRGTEQASPLPPVDAQLTVPRLELDAAVLSGVVLSTEAGEPAPAADGKREAEQP